MGTNARSWVVVTREKKPVVIGTNWQPGYTPGHCADPADAIRYAQLQRSLMRMKLLEEIDDLQIVLEELENQ